MTVSAAFSAATSLSTFSGKALFTSRTCERRRSKWSTHSIETSMLFDAIRRRFLKPPVIYDLEALAAAGNPAVEVHQLRKTFKRRVKKSGKRQESLVTAVDGLSFSVKRGEIFGLLGPNSSGKTTTLRCLSTLCTPDSGDIRFYGINIKDNDLLARNMMGFVAQQAGLDKVLTGREHLNLFAGLAHLRSPEKEAAIEQVIDVLDLRDYIDRLASVYSGGIIRRLDLAICLLHRPSILILDEPTVGLDVESRNVIWKVLKTLREAGATIILTSHYLEEVDILSDRVAIMEKGVVIASGTPTQLKDALGGDRITIRLSEFTSRPEAERAANEIRRRGLARDALVNQLRMNSIELVVDPEHTTIGTDIVRALNDIGFGKLFSFSQSKPSLDDVYLASTGRSMADADSAAKEKRDLKTMRKEVMK